jgi:ABC-type sulfate/molybdate transport systems ATPase subunit
MASADQGLVLQGLATEAGSFALGPINLTVARDRVLAILGPSGAGKTTLLETVAGFRRATAGHVRLGGLELTELVPERRRIGFVFQDAALFPHLSVRDNVRFALRMRDGRHVALADELLESFEIRALADRRPRTLSGGERQRVALARALAGQPALLLLDEPLSSLDQPTREELREVLLELLDDLQIPAVHVTHNRDEALSVGDDVAVIVAGRVRQLADRREIVMSPADAAVAPLLGWAELGPGVAAQGAVTVDQLRLPAAGFGVVPPDGPVRVFYRPENVALGDESRSAEGARLTAVVERILPTTPLARVTLSGSPQVTVLLLHRDLEQLGIHAGGVVEARFRPDSLRAFRVSGTA